MTAQHPMSAELRESAQGAISLWPVLAGKIKKTADALDAMQARCDALERRNDALFDAIEAKRKAFSTTEVAKANDQLAAVLACEAFLRREAAKAAKKTNAERAHREGGS